MNELKKQQKDDLKDKISLILEVLEGINDKLDTYCIDTNAKYILTDLLIELDESPIQYIINTLSECWEFIHEGV